MARIQARKSYVILSILALTFIAATGGCRVGNHSDPVGLPQSSDDITGVYRTKPQAVRYCAALESQETVCSDGDSIPGLPSGFFADPMAIIYQYFNEEFSALFNPALSQPEAMKIRLNSGDLSMGSSGELEQIKFDAGTGACTIAQSWIITGKAIRQSDLPPVNGLDIVGRMNVDFLYRASFQPETACQPVLDVLQDCYSDVNQCGSSTAEGNKANQDITFLLFKDQIDAGVFTAQQISSVLSMNYTVQYRQLRFLGRMV